MLHLLSVLLNYTNAMSDHKGKYCVRQLLTQQLDCIAR